MKVGRTSYPLVEHPFIIQLLIILKNNDATSYDHVEFLYW